MPSLGNLRRVAAELRTTGSTCRKKFPFRLGTGSVADMRRIALVLVCLTACLAAPFARAAEGRVVKVWPQYLDKEGRHTISASLFGRDIYQADLRRHPKDRGGLRVVVQWKARHVDWSNVRVRVEIRGLEGNTLRTETLEAPGVNNGWFSHWAELRLTGPQFENFGNIVAWRASLWDGGKELSSQQSFLWDGVLPPTSLPAH